jgi:hypothetical protein
MVKIKITVALLVIAAFLFSADAFAQRRRGSYDSYPAPDLLSPVTDNIDLTGKPALEFKWQRTAESQTDYYEFRLYKGYEMTEGSLIVKRKVEVGDYPVEVEAKKFEAGQVYSWSLWQVFIEGGKSDRARGTFKVIRK